MPFPSTPILDNFNRANGGLGSDWGDPGFPSGDITISGNRAVGSSSGEEAYWNHIMPSDLEIYFDLYATGTSDWYCSFRITQAPTIANYPSGITDGYTCHVVYDAATPSNSSIAVTRNDGSGAVGSAYVSSLAPDSVVGILAVGSSITVYHKPPSGAWTQVFTASDATFLTGSYIYFGVIGDAVVGLDNFGGGAPAPKENGGGYGGGTPGGDPGGGGGGGTPGPGGPGTGEPPVGGTPPDPGAAPGTDPPGGAIQVGGPAWVTNARQIAAFGVGGIGLRVTDVAYIQDVRVRGDYGIQVDADSIARTHGLQYSTSNILGTLNPLHGDRAAWDDIGYPGRHARDLWEGAPVYHNPPDAVAGQAPVWDGDKWVATSVVGSAEFNHDHDGAPTQKLAQANTHESPDTDAAAGSLHHTIGTGATQAAAGNHSHGTAPVGQAIFTVEGTLSVSTGKLRIYNQTGATKTISEVFLSANTAPTGAAIIVDVNKNGATIFTTQANRPQIAAGANTGTTTAIDVPGWADGDYLQVDIDQIGSGTAGADLTIHIVYS